MRTQLLLKVIYPLLFALFIIANNGIQAQNNYEFELDYAVRKSSTDAIVKANGESICLISEGTGTNFAASNLSKAYLLVFSQSGDTTTYHYSFGDTAFAFNRISASINDGFLITGRAKLYETEQTFLMAIEVDTNYQVIWVKFYEFSDYWMAWPNQVFVIKDKYIIGFSCCEPPCGPRKSGLMEINQTGDVIRQYLHNELFIDESNYLLNNDSTRIWLFNSYSVNYNLNSYRLVFDLEFNHIAIDMFPQLYYIYGPKWHNDSALLIPKNFKRPNAPTSGDRDLFIFAYDSLLNIKKQFSVGTQDTLEQLAFYTPLDFINSDTLFLLGTKNFLISLGVPSTISWLINAQVNKELNLRSVQFIGGDTYYQAYYVKATPDGGCLIHANKYIQGSLILNLIFIKYNREGTLVWTSDKDLQFSHAIVYPNPTTDLLTIECYLESYEFDLFDADGRLLLKQFAKSGKTSLSLLHLPQGIYTLRIFDQNKKKYETKKIIKQ